jgi:hypothetical protein
MTSGRLNVEKARQLPVHRAADQYVCESTDTTPAIVITEKKMSSINGLRLNPPSRATTPETTQMVTST